VQTWKKSKGHKTDSPTGRMEHVSDVERQYLANVWRRAL
jgi:hypothetical protein